MKKIILDEDAIIADYMQNKACKPLGEKYGCNSETIRRILIKHGIDRTGWKASPKPKHVNLVNDDNFPILLAIYEETQSHAETAKRFGCSPSYVSKVLISHGIIKDNNKRKVDLDELQKLAPIMTRAELAEHFNVHITNIERALKKQGLHAKCATRESTTLYMSHHSGRARKYGVEYDPTITRKKVIAKYHNICQICGKTCNPNDKSWGSLGADYPTIDHIIPMSKGGAHVWGNVQLACGYCNIHKGNKIS